MAGLESFISLPNARPLGEFDLKAVIYERQHRNSITRK